MLLALVLVLQYLPIGPMQALIRSAVINGIVAVPLLILVTRREIVGSFRTPRWLLILTGIATVIMGIAGVATIASPF